MFPYFGHLIGVLVIGVLYSTKIVSGRFCEGGHICSLPRECCTQGCCPPYQSGPRQLPPASDHVLNLFFISHWYFWCVVVAIILAILCAYSLWKKRRTLCGWGLAEHHTQSEGDSAGSCYAPPQYSRCNSFHHPPPPYTEVTSKPDLYPLVFTCNSDNGKNGSSYLMVQYFRNYIVRPAGSLSATSTVDSLSSSFICNANEANTLVPPPYSRATSPEIGGFSSHSQQHYMIPRSASQLVCANGNHDGLGGNLALQQVYQPRNSQYGNTGSVNISAVNQGARDAMTYYNSSQPRMVESGVDSAGSGNNGPLFQARAGNNSSGQLGAQRTNGFVQSQSDQHFRYIANSNSTISDIFVNNSCTADLDDAGGTERLGNNEQGVQENSHSPKLSIGAGTPAIYSNGCIQTNPLVHKVISSPKQLVQESSNAVYNSNSSIGGISITVPVATDVTDAYRNLDVLRRSLETCDEYRDFDGDLDGLRRSLETCDEYRDLDVLRRSLETCCQFLQQQQIPTAASFASGDSPLRMHDFAKKYGDESMRSYMTSGTCSAVSSLANIGTPSSPPQATSPTGEIKEMLDQIRQLQTGAANIEEALLHPRPHLLHTMSSPSPTHQSTQLHADSIHQLQRFPTMPEKHRVVTVTPNALIRSTHNPPVPKTAASSASIAPNSQQPTSSLVVTKRPSTLNQNKKKFFTPKPNKALYIPMMANPSQPNLGRSHPKSPISSVVGVSFFNNRGRVRKGWISRSAPTTPGTGLPPNSLGDDSPLLNEHDEDQEMEHNLE